MEREREGIAGQPLRGVGQHKTDAVFRAAFHCELRADAEAVDGHGIFTAAIGVFPVCQTADVGKEVRIAALPVFRAALPEVFPAVCADAVQHGAHAVERDGELCVLDGDQCHIGQLPFR